MQTQYLLKYLIHYNGLVDQLINHHATAVSLNFNKMNQFNESHNQANNANHDEWSMKHKLDKNSAALSRTEEQEM